MKKPGYYLVYNQMYYCEGHALEMAHFTYINHDKVMESVSSVVSSSRKYSTRFQAGVFALNAGDHISVRGLANMSYRMVPSSTYFGLIMLFPTGTGN